MHKLFHSAIRRWNNPRCSIALDNAAVSNEVIGVINSVHSIRPALNQLARFLNREVVVSVLRSQAQLRGDPRVCFRFFVWTAGKARFRSGVAHNIIVHMLLNREIPNSFDLYWSVLDEWRSESLPTPADAFVVLILGYWRLGMAEKAVETFERMEEYECQPNLAAYNVILNVLVKQGAILLGMAIFNRLIKLNFRMGCDTYNVLIDGLFKNGMTLDALQLFDEMTERGILASKVTYTSIMSGLCKAVRVDDACQIFRSMKDNGCKSDALAYNALLDGFCKCGRIGEALALFESSMDDGCSVGLTGYSCLIHALMKAKRINEAEELIQKVFDVGLEPDLVLYTILLRRLCEAGRVQEAIVMLQDMIGKGVVPDTQCYNVLIKGFCDLGLLDQAQSLRLEISQHDRFPNAHTYTILICGLCRNGLVGEAQQIFNDMEKLGCSPSVATFNALIDGLCKAGKLEEAHLMLYKMEVGKNPCFFLRLSQGTDRVSLHKMVENLVDSGSVLKAYKLLMQLVESTVLPDIQTYNTLINGMCKAGQMNGALKLVEALQLRGHFPDSVTYGTLINGLQKADREGDAIRLFEQMNESGCKPSQAVYMTLMTWSCRRRKISVAFGLWLSYLRSLGGWQEEVLKSVHEYFKNGELLKAVRSLIELEIKLADFDLAPYNIWLAGLCQDNRVDEALKVFFLLEEFNVPIFAPGCVRLIRAFCLEGNLNGAVDVFLYTMKKGYLLMPRICNRLLKELLKSKDGIAVSSELLEKMKSAGYDLNSRRYLLIKSLFRQHYSMKQKAEMAGRMLYN